MGKETLQVTMAKADDDDLGRVRRLIECLDVATVSGIDDDGVLELVERYQEAENSLERVVTGYQLLRDSFCDPNVSHLQFNPQLEAAARREIYLEVLEALSPSDEEVTGVSTSRPTAVCLCGSTRFKQQFIDTNFELTMAGRIVLTVGWFGHADGLIYTPTAEEKIALDELHKRKIDLADEIMVINVGGYVGESTRSEIAYALKTGKPVRWLEPGDVATDTLLSIIKEYGLMDSP